MHRIHRDELGQSLVIVLSLITILFLLGSSLAVHASVALRATRTTAGQGNDFYAADAATELGIWWQRKGMAGNPPAQTINGITTSTTITSVGGGGGSCPVGDPKPVWLSGMESGVKEMGANNLPNFTGGGFYNGEGDVTVVSSPVRTGNYSLRVHPTATTRADIYVRDMNGTGTLGPDIAVRYSVRLDVLPGSDVTVAAVTYGGCGPCGPHGKLYLFYRAGTQTWQMGYSLAEAVGSTPVVAGTWYSIDVHTNPQSDTRWAEWQVDGVAQPNVGPYTEAGGWVTSVVHFGIPFADASTTDYTAYFDDIEITNTVAQYPLGDTKILGLLPNGMGTNNDATKFQNDNSTAIDANSWQRLDELPMSSITDYIKQIGTTTGGEYAAITFQDTTETCIRGASIVAAVHSANTQGNNAAVNSVTNGYNYNLYAGDFSETTIRYIQRPVTQNSGSPGTGPWTQAIVNGITARFGMSTDVNPIPYIDALLLEVAYRPLVAGPATITIVGTGGGSTVSTSYTDAGAGVPTLSTWTTTK
jgi:Tfp pilus assembly protein PilX